MRFPYLFDVLPTQHLRELETLGTGRATRSSFRSRKVHRWSVETTRLVVIDLQTAI